MIVLGIESSCDETAAAVVRDGTQVLSSVIYSQVPLHQPYGGVVPEIASRSHIEKIRGIIEQALKEAFPDAENPLDEVDAIAATCGPGLAASLLVGWSAAKGLALASGKPLIPVNHMHAHLWSVQLDRAEVQVAEQYPQLGLAVSGGHTCFVEATAPNVYHLIGQTIDDAAGEAFDKAAKLLGLGYPGGPVIDRVARTIPVEERRSIAFPQGKVSAEHPLPEGLRAELCVSFSGLKTALLTYVRKNPPQSEEDIARICAAYQEAIVDALVKRADIALRTGKYKTFAVGGGVSLNGRLREALEKVAKRHRVPLLVAQARYCGDNAAMIAGLASVDGGLAAEDPLMWDIDPSLPV
jgi:N6-L-threonylcarbamoyladenine synthase